MHHMSQHRLPQHRLPRRKAAQATAYPHGTNSHHSRTAIMTSTFIRRCAGIATAVALALTPCFVSAPAPGALAPLGTQRAGAAQLIDRIPQSVDPISLTTQPYTVPDFPSTATVHWSDGSTSQEPVTWEYSLRQSYTYANDDYYNEKTVTATSDEVLNGMKVTATVTVAKMAALSIEPVSVWIVKGGYVSLPRSVKVNLPYVNYDYYRTLVTWDTSSVKTSVPGTYHATGTLDKPVVDTQGTTISTITAQVRVLDSYPVSALSFNDPGTLTVGKSATVTATATMTDSSYQASDLSYSWSSSDTDVVSFTYRWWEPTQAFLVPKKEGTATITVEAGGHTASRTVTVEPAGPTTVTSVRVDSDKIPTTDSGQVPTLPTTATVSWSDNTTTKTPITWNSYTADYFDWASNHSRVTCTGHVTVNGRQYSVSQDVSIHTPPISRITGFEDYYGNPLSSTVYASAGSSFADLPSEATFVTVNGKTGSGWIRWDNPDASKFSSPGTFTVSGTVDNVTYSDGSSVTVTATVIVQNVTIKSTPIPDVRIDAGSAPTFPSVLRATWDNGNVSEASVVWNTDPSMWRGSRDSETTQTVTGTLTSQGVTVHPMATVHINQATASSATNVRVTTEAGVIPALPQNVDVRWNNGDVTSQHVYWNNAKPLNPASYATVGTFTVSGVVTGAHTLNDATIPVTATVTVTEKKQTSDESPITMQRLYNPNTGEHFFTGNAEELGQLVAQGWRNESTAWTAPAAGDVVYRLYNPSGSEHHYTMDANEVNTLMGIGWNFESVGWRSAPADSGVPVYRLYNPNAASNGHHYTTDAAERDQLVSQGWHDEGIAWYGVKDASSTATDGSTK